MANDDLETTVYGVIGEDGFARLVAAFYRRVPTDDVLGPMYPPHDLQSAEARLRGFLIYRFGGPQLYIAQRGHPRLGMRHAPFRINQAVRDRWMKLMGESLAEVDLPKSAADVLRQFFEQTATFLMNDRG